MLLAAGAVWMDSWLAGLRRTWILKTAAWAALATGGALAAAVALPLAPVNSSWWKFAVRVNSDLPEEIGWPDFVRTVATIRDSLPADERKTAGILAGNYGEAGAIDLFGPAYALPAAISGVNSYYLHGYGDLPPQIVILTGFSEAFGHRTFESCTLAGHVTNQYGVANEETSDHGDIFLCRGIRRAWPEFWKDFQRFG
jgi:hypothetical protein